MRRVFPLAATLLLFAACTSFSAAPDNNTQNDGGPSNDAGGDANLPDAGLCRGVLAAPTRLTLNFGSVVSARRGLGNIVYVSLNRSPDIALASATLAGGALTLQSGADPVSPMESSRDDAHLAVGDDGRYAVFATTRPDMGVGTPGLFRLYWSSRATPDQPFDSPRALSVSTVDPSTSLDHPWLVGRTGTLYFTSTPPGGPSKIMRARARSGSGSSHDPEDVGVEGAEYPVVQDNELLIYFAKMVGGAMQIMRSSRPNPNVGFQLEETVSILNDTSSDAYPTWISKDGCELWFVSNRDGGPAIYRAERAEL